jgi:hypothetical protein
VLVNPDNVQTTEALLRDIPEAARAIGWQIQVLKASTSREIEAAFATLVSDRAGALFIAPDAFFSSQRVQFAILATRYAVPTAWANRDAVEAGGLLSYTTDTLDMFNHVGFYTGIILKGIKPADLPVVQASTATPIFMGNFLGVIQKPTVFPMVRKGSPGTGALGSPAQFGPWVTSLKPWEPSPGSPSARARPRQLAVADIHVAAAGSLQAGGIAVAADHPRTPAPG